MLNNQNFFEDKEIQELLNKWLYSKYEKLTSEVLKNSFFEEYKKNLKFITNEKIKIKFLSENYFNKSMYIVHKFSNDPWTVQIDIIKLLEITKEDLIILNKIIRNSNFFQEIILNKGIGNKYWNSIIPFARRTDLVLENKISLPKRIVIFPGVSCMFFCGFCGRNQSAKYPMSAVEKGTSIFKKLFSETQNNTAYSIGGGLEPTTNPQLGEIVKFASENKIRLPLITNGYSLTENYIKKNSNIWKLDSLRLSLYGIDEESYFFITRLKKSYKMVMKNSVNFLKLRNEFNPNLKFGLNFIVIPENMDQVIKILDVVEEINNNVLNGKGVDFITLRDDFQAVTGHDELEKKDKKYTLDSTMSNNLREKLFVILKEFNLRKEKNFPDIHIDYGYSIDAVSKGITNKGLQMATNKILPEYGYPQLSLAIDLYGDVFLYREAGFLDRYGNKKFIIGRITPENSLKEIIEKFLKRGIPINYEKSDTKYLDSFDHVLASIVNQAKNDKDNQLPFAKGPILARTDVNKLNLGNNWYTDDI